MTHREFLKTNPGYMLYQQGRAAFRGLLSEQSANSPQGRMQIVNRFVMHDLKTGINILDFFRLSVDKMMRADKETDVVYSPEVAQAINSYYFASREGNRLIHRPISPRETILACDSWVESIKHLIEIVSSLREDPDIFTQKAQAMVRSWGMFHHSSQFLIGLSTNNERQAMRSLGKLRQEQITISDLVALTMGDKESHVHYTSDTPNTVNGVEAIMLYNLLKNAAVYSRSAIVLTYSNGTWKVRNDAKVYPNTQTLFQPGKPGEGGNTGFGLFTMKYMIGALGGYDVALSNANEEQNSPPFEVEFSISPHATGIVR